MKREESKEALLCTHLFGPCFGKMGLCVSYECNKSDNYVTTDVTKSYECHPEYKNSLFVNTAGPDEDNKFIALDYEVFAIDYESKYTIDHLCNYPDIIWEYIETKDISEESLKQADNEHALLSDLDTIHCNDNNILIKISRNYLKDPSKFLPDSQLVNQQYDEPLKEWLGSDKDMKLLYRASEHDYTAESFHECCNYNEPTLIVIKSSEGWIFGGYTTQSWSGDCIYMIIFIL